MTTTSVFPYTVWDSRTATNAVTIIPDKTVVPGQNGASGMTILSKQLKSTLTVGTTTITTANLVLVNNQVFIRNGSGGSATYYTIFNQTNPVVIDPTATIVNFSSQSKLLIVNSYSLAIGLTDEESPGQVLVASPGGGTPTPASIVIKFLAYSSAQAFVVQVGNDLVCDQLTINSDNTITYTSLFGESSTIESNGTNDGTYKYTGKNSGDLMSKLSPTFLSLVFADYEGNSGSNTDVTNEVARLKSVVYELCRRVYYGSSSATDAQGKNMYEQFAQNAVLE